MHGEKELQGGRRRRARKWLSHQLRMNSERRHTGTDPDMHIRGGDEKQVESLAICLPSLGHTASPEATFLWNSLLSSWSQCFWSRDLPTCQVLMLEGRAYHKRAGKGKGREHVCRDTELMPLKPQGPPQEEGNGISPVTYWDYPPWRLVWGLDSVQYTITFLKN